MGTRTTQCNRTIVENSDIIVMAVKPNMVRRILTDIYPSITKDHLVISVAAGISIDTMQQVELCLLHLADYTGAAAYIQYMTYSACSIAMLMLHCSTHVDMLMVGVDF